MQMLGKFAKLAKTVWAMKEAKLNPEGMRSKRRYVATTCSHANQLCLVSAVQSGRSGVVLAFYLAAA